MRPGPRARVDIHLRANDKTKLGIKTQRIESSNYNEEHETNHQQKHIMSWQNYKIINPTCYLN